MFLRANLEEVLGNVEGVVAELEYAAASVDAAATLMKGTVAKIDDTIRLLYILCFL